jgi:hypothetical protein
LCDGRSALLQTGQGHAQSQHLLFTEAESREGNESDVGHFRDRQTSSDALEEPTLMIRSISSAVN